MPLATTIAHPAPRSARPTTHRAAWAAANRAMYLPQIAGRTHPDSAGTTIVGLARTGDYNLAPTISPDGKLFAFFSSRNLFSIDLFVGDAQ